MKADSHSPSPAIVSARSAPAGVAPLAARSDRFTATSFQPTLAGGSSGRKWTPSAILSWVSTSPSSNAASSSNPRAAGAVAIFRQRSMICSSRMRLDLRRADTLGNRVEQAVDEAALALVVKGVGDVDIFGDDRRQGHVGPGNQLIGAGT